MGIAGKRGDETPLKNPWRITMEHIQLIVDKITGLLTWGLKYGVWLSAGGALTFFLFISFGLGRDPYR
jgi:hypothetical protein